MARLFGFVGDVLGLRRVCGWRVATRWVAKVISSAPAIVQQRNLQPADLAMGEGPFACRRGPAVARLVGPQVLSGVREIWCRDVYLGRDLIIPDGSVVVDLGANMGNFTMLALASGPRVRVVAVEPNPALCRLLERQLRTNAWAERCVVINAFVGELTDTVTLEGPDGAPCGPAKPAGFAEVFAATGGRIDLLKCDIEGSEFGLLTSGSGWLESASQVAMEVHFDMGQVATMEGRLAAAGFVVHRARTNPRDAIVRAWKTGAEKSALRTA
jgi:hypothetical protein